MSRSWNGYDLVNEFSALLGDTGTAFKARVLGWLNDIVEDISASHDWPHLKVKGQKKLTALAENHNLYIAAPGAPSVAIAAGGSLTDGSVYKVYVTFYQSSNGYESTAGTASATATATAVNKTINVTSIPTSTEPLVTSRRIYLQKDSGEIYYYSEIADNTTTTATITAEVSSTIEPPDIVGIEKVIGDPWLETSSQLEYRDLDQLRLLFMGSWESGTPSYWAGIGNNQITLYPTPSSAMTLSYYYKRRPAKLYNSTDSQPDLPLNLKSVLRAGVIAYGFEYRDRNGQESKRSNYEMLLREAISEQGSDKRRQLRVRDVVGDSDGWEA